MLFSAAARSVDASFIRHGIIGSAGTTDKHHPLLILAVSPTNSCIYTDAGNNDPFVVHVSRRA
jgi:hypothetical protein